MVCRIQLHVIANEKIEVAVPVIIEKSTAGAPADLCLVKPGLVRDIGKRAVSVVVEKNVVSPEAAKQVIPSIVVVIAHADAGLPTCAPQSRLLRDIGKRAVAIVLVKVRGRRFSRRPMRIQPISIGKVDVQPSIIVVVEKGQSASLGLDDGSFVVDAAPHVGAGQPGLAAPRPHTAPEMLSERRLPLPPGPRFLHFQRGVARASVSVLPSMKRDEPRKRLRGKIIDCDDYRDLSGRSSWNQRVSQRPIRKRKRES